MPSVSADEREEEEEEEEEEEDDDDEDEDCCGRCGGPLGCGRNMDDVRVVVPKGPRVVRRTPLDES